MILKTYIFSQVSGRYQQYTSDNSETFLREICKNCSTPNQIAVHRDGNLMYYAYLHKSSNSEIYGICVVCGEICLDIEGLYKIFHQTFESAAHKGVLFKYDNNGNIRKNVDYFSNEAAEVFNVFNILIDLISEQSSFWESLPPEDLSIPLDSVIGFAFNEDEANKIVDATRHYHNVIVTLENLNPSSFSMIVRTKNKENETLKETIVKLKAENEKILRQKKQFKNVVLLTLVVIGCGIGLYFLYENLNNTQGQLNEANEKIERKNNIITAKEGMISSQKNMIDSLTMNYNNAIAERNQVQEQYSDLKNTINDALPFIFKGSSFNFSSGYYKISYYGLEEGYKTIKIRVLYPDGGDPSTYPIDLNISKGSNDANVYIYDGFNSSRFYTFEILYNDRVIGGGRH